MISEPQQTPAQRRNLMFLGVAGGLGIASLVVLLATLLLTGTAAAGSAGRTASGIVSTERYSAACLVTQYKDQGRAHTQNIKEQIPRNSFPPTSGMHYVGPARWGNYTSPIAQIQGIHNLEHGGIIIQYGDRVSAADRDALNAYYDKDPNGLLMAPLNSIGTRIAVTAWTHLMVCQKLDTRALDKFKKTFRYKAPEALPKAALEPGR